MRGFAAFTRKELLEQLRTYKALILLAVFTLFGMTSPLLAKLMPELLSLMDMGGVAIQLPQPTYLDAYTQFFKNVGQMGFIVLLLVLSGTLSQELTKGTLVNLIAKGLPRGTVLFSKYTAGLLLWTLGYWLAALLSWCYTLYLFPDGAPQRLGLAFLCMWLFGAFALAVLLLSSALVGGGYGGLLLTAVILGALLFFNMAPAIQPYNPASLTVWSNAIVTGDAALWKVYCSMGVTAGGIVLCLLLAVPAFNRKQL